MTAIVQKYKNNLGRRSYRIVTKINGKQHVLKFNPNSDEYKFLDNPKNQALLDANTKAAEINSTGTFKYYSGLTVVKALELLKAKERRRYNNGELSFDEKNMTIYNCDTHIGKTSLVNVELKDLVQGHGDILCDELLAKGCSNDKIGRVLTTLKAALQACIQPPSINGKVQKPLLDANPLQKYSFKPGQRITKAVEIPTKKDCAKFIEAAPGIYQLMFKTISLTGMRWGEIAALKWSRIGWNSQMLTIDHAVKRKDGLPKIYPEPKTAAGNRAVPIGSELLAALRLWKDNKDSDNDLVFGKNGTFIPHATAKDNFNKTKEQLNLDWVGGMHSLRHYYASMIIEWHMKKMINIKQVTTFMGHTDLNFTLKVYAKCFQDDDAWMQTVDKIDQYLSG